MTTEIRMDCIISGPSVHGRGGELQEFTGEKSWCYEDDPVTKWQHGVGGGKISLQPNSCIAKITCEDGADHLSKPILLQYGLVVSLCV
jgi:hypothetical protein